MTADVRDATRGHEGLPEPIRLGAYRLVQRLGEGGMGEVHLGLDRHGKAVAVKVLRPHIAHDPSARARLSREVETLSRVRSPRVAPVIDADVDGERPFVVTRYVPALALDEVIAARGPMSGADLHRLGAGLAEALDAIHSCDVIHRDLKPGNVLILDGDPVVIDFGIAHVADDVRLTMTGLVMGTPGYLAPEVIEGAAVSPATDWWGWAATLAFAASGRPPFGRGPMDAVLGRVAAGDPDLSGVDERLAPLLYAALSPAPSERPPEREVVAALERFAGGGAVTEVMSRVRTRPVVAPTVAQPVAAPTVAQPTAAMPVAQPTVGQPAVPPVSPQVAPNPPVPNQVAPDPPVPQAYSPHQAPNPVPGSYAQAGTQGELAAYPQAENRPTTPGNPEGFWDGSWDRAQAVDPRSVRGSRSGTVVAMGALVVALAAVAPVVAAVVLVVWVLLARLTDRSMTSMIMRRHDKGPRRSDIPVAVLASPWHLLVAAVGTIFSALMPALIAVSGVFCGALAVVALRGGGSPEPNDFAPLAAGGALAALMVWWGPAGASLRRGTRSMLRGLTPTPMSARVFVVLLLAAAAGVALWGVSQGEPTWWPVGSPLTEVFVRP